MTIHAFHGFLGNTQDFAYIQNARTYDFNTLCEQNKDDLLNSMLEKTIAGDNLVGYSFGGRFAMQLFLKDPSRFKKVIIISSHCGLKDKSAKMQRVLFDQKCADKLRELSEEEFLNGWNSQEVFANDTAIERFPTKNKNILARFFTEYGLSTQDYLIDDLLEFKDKLVFLYGANDSKYSVYGRENIKSMGFETYIITGAGHRLHKTHGDQVLKVVNRYA
jgi:pimeloyl-ACP methyl ester carboxylesterase